MSKKVDALRAIGIYNGWAIAMRGPAKVFLSYSAEGRGCGGARWSVVGCGFKTDIEAPWYYYGCKSFSGNMRSVALEGSKDWATQKYGIAEWVKDPFGCWQDRRAMEKVERLLSARRPR